MGERSRFSLPSLGIVPMPSNAPDVDQARTALGGRVSTQAGAGTCVRVIMKRGAAAIGVLVCLHDGERDVWIGEGRFVRVSASAVAALVDEETSLAAVAADARAFASLREGDSVVYVDRRGVEGRGTLVEKCRYGGLVATGDGKIVAVSFRRLRGA